MTPHSAAVSTPALLLTEWETLDYAGVVRYWNQLLDLHDAQKRVLRKLVLKPHGTEKIGADDAQCLGIAGSVTVQDVQLLLLDAVLQVVGMTAERIEVAANAGLIMGHGAGRGDVIESDGKFYVLRGAGLPRASAHIDGRHTSVAHADTLVQHNGAWLCARNGMIMFTMQPGEQFNRRAMSFVTAKDHLELMPPLDAGMKAWLADRRKRTNPDGMHYDDEAVITSFFVYRAHLIEQRDAAFRSGDIVEVGAGKSKRVVVFHSLEHGTGYDDATVAWRLSCYLPQSKHLTDPKGFPMALDTLKSGREPRLRLLYRPPAHVAGQHMATLALAVREQMRAKAH